MTLEGRPSSAWWSQARLLPMLLWATAGVCAIAGLMSLWLASRVPSTISGEELTSRMDNSWTLLATATGLLLIITGVVWLAWQRGLARLLLAEGDMRRSPQMQMVAWVIPVVAWWWPLRDIRELHGFFDADEVEFTDLTRRWWICWLAFGALQLVAAWIEGSVHTAPGVRVTFVVTGLAGLAALPAAHFATMMVRQLTGHVVTALGH
ncbi:protein of unknown function [Propionibacterium cyclohexanicum]|uniref:DUF4328 domain-containing protein n=1 Tax=Propionibacterium cyclohexanicum TaxID=64702 RepID=A0A1H9RUC1_9ACTN|nr:DUF4328 domain-containing protein [Propionibacterium cyclohexanicum]SER76402.1 protein of unknown function [Propionibacterium cyclohexanicum]